MSPDSPILSAAIDEFQKIKKLADKSIDQLADEQLQRRPSIPTPTASR